MTTITLKDWQIEEIEDFLLQTEKQFNIELESEELVQMIGIEELCDTIIKKIPLQDEKTCTSQQAFYKIKQVLKKIKGESIEITPSTKLDNIFCSKNEIQNLEIGLGISLNLFPLKGCFFTTLSCLLALCVSFYLSVGFITLILFILFSISIELLISEKYRLKKYLREATVRDLINDTMPNNYLAFRSDKNTINTNELNKIFLNRISESLGIDQKDLSLLRF